MSHGRVQLTRCRRACRSIHTASTSSTGGHTQPSAVITEAPGANSSRATPISARTAAGTSAHRCGWLVQRVDSSASAAQPSANPSSAVPVMTCSRAPSTANHTRTNAATAPRTREPATIQPIGPRRGGGAPGCGGDSGSVAVGRAIAHPTGWKRCRTVSRVAGSRVRSPGEVEAGDNGDGDDRGGDEVDGGAEGRPPAGAGDEAGAVLPHVLEAVAGQAGDDQPGRSGHRGRGDDHEGRRDRRLDGEDVPAPVGDGEADVDRGDQGKPEGVDGSGVQPEEGQGEE